jgi:hypothetical protein
LAGHNDEDTLSEELESRLDDLFGEDDQYSDGPVTDGSPRDYPLSELKNLVLSIDWEITDDVLQKFIDQIGDLKTTYKDDKINLTFLQILGSLGEYIKINRGKAHPKTFKILNSVFSQFDEVVLNVGMPEIEKKKILRAEMNKYKLLREQIAQERAAKQKKKPVKSAAPVKRAELEDDTDVADQAYAAQIAIAVEDIKRFIRAEFKALRQELNLIQK